MQLDTHAAVTQTGTVTISAPIEKVWKLMSDIDKWPEWNKDVAVARLNGDLRAGTTFTWKAGPGTITSRLEAVEENRLIAWSGKTMGIKAVHIWRLDSKGSETVVTTEESWDGILARLLKGYSERTLSKAITDGLQLLKHAAENLA
jgi:uncharacterized protein YndB with AHSA1/START domain